MESEQIQNRDQNKEEIRAGDGDDGDGGVDGEIFRPSFPLSRVKKIIKLDQEIRKINSEALSLISIAAEMFLISFAERSREEAVQSKRRAIRQVHLWHAAAAHQPTADFLLDCLSHPSLQEHAKKKQKKIAAVVEKPVPPGLRRIDEIFSKPATDSEDAAVGDGDEGNGNL